jgi:hypothetical protein
MHDVLALALAASDLVVIRVHVALPVHSASLPRAKINLSTCERKRLNAVTAIGLGSIQRETWHDHSISRSHPGATKQPYARTCPLGNRFVFLQYETRYPFKLVRELGTLRADLFADCADAIGASRRVA